jgi:hypothetical protein
MPRVFAAQQELGVGKGQPVGVGIERVAVVGVVLQFGPGVGQAAVVELGIGFHGASLCRRFMRFLQCTTVFA